MTSHISGRDRVSESRAAIERLYISMRHLFIRGNYKPLGVSGESLINALMTLRPEIYGSISDPERVELGGLLYIFKRLPKGIETARYIHLISREGLENSKFVPLVAAARRRNCYQIDEEQIFIEMTRGRSDVYDILTHLTFMFIEARKIYNHAIDHRKQIRREWLMLEDFAQKEMRGEEFDKAVAFSYLSTILGRTFGETVENYKAFQEAEGVSSLLTVVYWLGRRALEEENSEDNAREITFSSALREKIGHHIYGEIWATKIKKVLLDKGLIARPLHIISANLHSVMNTLYAKTALGESFAEASIEEVAKRLSLNESKVLRQTVRAFALQNGMIEIADDSGMNISVQIFDTEQLDPDTLSAELNADANFIHEQKPVLFVMDYAFGEQAFETMDELLKPFEHHKKSYPLNVQSISIMGKAGILEGGKGDIMLPSAHIFEGTADNYPFDNDISKADFEDEMKRGELFVCEGPMVSVLGTSLQNRDILKYFHDSSWKVVGLEMEGAHYQKAIQAAAKIRKNISENVTVRYAYYASDNPLLSGHTLASGSLGLVGVRPTYIITIKLLHKIFKA